MDECERKGASLDPLKLRDEGNSTQVIMMN